MAEYGEISPFYGEDYAFGVQLAPVPEGGIVGWSIRFLARASWESGQSDVIVKTVGSGVTITSGAGGTFTVSLSSADTQKTPGAYEFSIARTDSGNRTVLTWGKLTIREPPAV